MGDIVEAYPAQRLQERHPCIDRDEYDVLGLDELAILCTTSPYSGVNIVEKSWLIAYFSLSLSRTIKKT